MSLCADRVEGLRSKTATLELEMTILKSQRVTDRARIEDLQRDVSILQTSSHSLSGRLRRMAESMERLQTLNDQVRDACADIVLRPENAWSYSEPQSRSLAFELENPGTRPHYVSRLVWLLNVLNTQQHAFA